MSQDRPRFDTGSPPGTGILGIGVSVGVSAGVSIEGSIEDIRSVVAPYEPGSSNPGTEP